MDNARVCVKAGKMVEQKYPWIFRVDCTAHALDLALEDMNKSLEWFRTTVKRGNQLGKFIMNHDKVRALFLSKSGGAQIKRPGVTRFATNIIMLKSLSDVSNALKVAVGDKGWVPDIVRPDLATQFEEATTTVLDDTFWDDVDKALPTTDSIMALQRLVDGPGGTLPKVYHRMDTVVESIRKLDVLTDHEKGEVEVILMDRWAFMTSELHCAAAFLDPEYRADGYFKDTEIRAGFNIWLYTWCKPEQFDDISWQVDEWVHFKGSFQLEESMCTARTKTPAMWWDAFGSRLYLLQPQAIRLLGQASSSAACERNWSLHELIFGRRRTKMLPTHLSKLVYNNWNLHLQWRQEHGQGEVDVHIPWLEDMPDEEREHEVEAYYNEWVRRVKRRAKDGGSDLEEGDGGGVGEEEDDEVPMARRWLHNDDMDDYMDHGIRQLNNYTHHWHFNTMPGRHRERLLRRLSGQERPAPEVQYNLEERDRALRAKETGAWVDGREEGGSRRQHRRARPGEGDGGRKRTAEVDIAPAPKWGRGRPSNKEKAERNAAEKAVKKASASAKKKSSAAKKKAAAAKKKKGKVIDDDNTPPCSASSSSSSDDDDGDDDADGAECAEIEHPPYGSPHGSGMCGCGSCGCKYD
ncbi:hypothetical protein CBR_g51014 [Chara braunii]|uniref:HAT C-terminal dimerisation domain-containing protein n=1 Tax=Chara braunii TaxID=69332 RepID=A0A388M807_CHABU|nr:hypothetical protein CBR_g51014 [Chara braunii]|eukprot:GBG90666.1 hypothetical protein CBR_g51014 [Chara braunii]